MLVGALFEIRPLIGSFVLALGNSEFRDDAPVIARLKIADLQLAFVNDGERRRLHAPDGGDVAGARTKHAFGDRAGAVDADEPVAFAPGTGGVREAAHFTLVAQMLEGVPNCLRGHGLQPEAFDGVFVLGQKAKVVENELALAAGVAGVDDFADVFSGDQFLQVSEDVLRFIDRLELELLRDNWKSFQTPESVFFLVDVLRHEELGDMADGRRDNVFIVLVVATLLRHLAQGARKVARNAGFFGDDERFGHFLD